MAAPIGNKYWQLRSKHGRDKLFATPELLWEAAKEYFEWCDNNPVLKEDYVGKDADRVERQLQRPYTISGLCVYIDASRQWWNEFRGNASQDFLVILTRIEEIIYSQKFDGAAVGVFNQSIIARDLGLVEKTESKVEAKVEQIDYSQLSESTLNEIAKLKS